MPIMLKFNRSVILHKILFNNIYIYIYACVHSSVGDVSYNSQRFLYEIYDTFTTELIPYQDSLYVFYTQGRCFVI